MESLNIDVVKSNLLRLLTLLIVFFSVLSTSSFAQRTYYISSTLGDDSNNGLSKTSNDNYGPWKTLSKINESNFNPGDSILLNRGDTWDEQLVVSSSGTSNSCIYYGVYGSGQKPIINGANTISGWKHYDEKSNIWVTTIGHNIEKITQVFVDNGRYTLARWPNSGWNTIDSTSTTATYLYDDEINQPDDYWSGAKLVIRSCMFSIDTVKISSSSRNEHKIYWDEKLKYGRATKNYGYYIENKLEELDFRGEYYFDMVTNRLFIALPPNESPLNHIIDVSNGDYNIYASNIKNVSICDIDTRIAGKYGIRLSHCNQVKISNCDIGYSKSGGIYCSEGKNLFIMNNTIKYVDEGNGINLNYCPNTHILNNVVHDIASDFSSPRKGRGICLYGTSGNSKILENKIYNIGNHGILVSKGPVKISENMISKCVIQTQDNGAIYLNADQTGSVIEYNQIDDCPGNYQGTPVTAGFGSTVGLYLDETNSHGAIFRYNIVSGCSKGIHLHKSYKTKVYNNVFYNNNVSISLQESEQNQMHHNFIKNNICYSTSESQTALVVYRNDHSTNSVGELNYNLYYNPYKTDIIRYKKKFTLSQWREREGIDSGNDANSIMLNPEFVDIMHNDFHLNKLSPCINAGEKVGGTKDFDDTSVPQCENPDIGAFEYYETLNK